MSLQPYTSVEDLPVVEEKKQPDAPELFELSPDSTKEEIVEVTVTDSTDETETKKSEILTPSKKLETVSVISVNLVLFFG